MNKKSIFLIALSFFITAITLGQTITQTNTQFPNPGFEAYKVHSSASVATGTNGTWVPYNWHTFDEANAAMTGLAALGNSTAKKNHHNYQTSGGKSGAYFEMICKEVLNIPANGALSCGRTKIASMTAASSDNYNYTDPSAGSSYSTSGKFSWTFVGCPDSMSFYYRTQISNSNHQPLFKVFLHGNAEFRDRANGSLYGNSTAELIGCSVDTFARYQSTTDWKREVKAFMYTRPGQGGSEYTFKGQTASVNANGYYSSLNRPTYMLASFSTEKKAGTGTDGDKLAVDELWCIYDKGLKTLSINGASQTSMLNTFNNAEFATHEPSRTYNSIGKDGVGDPIFNNSGTASANYTEFVCFNSTTELENLVSVTPKSKLITSLTKVGTIPSSGYPYVTITITHNDNSTFAYTIYFTGTIVAPTVTQTQTPCGAGDATLTVSNPDANCTYSWYSSNSSSSAIATGTSLTRNISANTTFYVEANRSGCKSNRVAFEAAVSPKPATPSVQDVTRCGNGSVTFEVTPVVVSPVEYRWFANGSSQYATSQGNYTTPSLTQTTTYTVYAINTAANCQGDSKEVVATVNPTVGAPVNVVNGSRCGAGTVTLQATAGSNGTTCRWYASMTGGNVLATGTSFETPSLNANTSYYVASYNETTGCESDNRVEVTATIGAAPTAPVINKTTYDLCGAASVDLTGTVGAGATMTWYAADNSVLGTGSPFTLTNLNMGTTTVYAAAVNGDCASEKTTITINNNATPAAPVATSDSRCGAGQITLHASAAAGMINWYANNTTETSLATGADFTTPELTSGVMTYYVGVTNNNCPSARVPVTATINPVPATPVTTPVAACDSYTGTLQATCPSGATLYWYNGSHVAMANAQVTNVTSTTTYSVVAKDNTTQCQSAEATLTVTVNAAPAVPTLNNATPICVASGSTIQLSATPAAGATCHWYTDASHNGKTEGNTRGLTNVTAAATYYVTSVTAAGCESEDVVVNVNLKPATPAISDVTLCKAGEMTINEIPAAGYTYNWYNGETLYSSVSPLVMSVSGNTTLYVEAVNNTTGCVSDKDAIAVIISESIAAPTVTTPVYACGGMVTLTATPATGTSLKWYDATNAYLQSGTSYEISDLTADATYYVTSSVGDCESDPVAINVKYSAIPAEPVADNASVCQGAAVELTAYATENTECRWYANATTSTILYTGETYSPDALAVGEHTYYVSLYNTISGCEGPRKAVTATVNARPEAPTTDNIINCGTYTGSLTATSTNSLIWKDAADNTVNAANVTVENTTTYTVIAVDERGCQSTPATLTVTINPKPAAPVAEPVAPICSNDRVNVTMNATVGANGTTCKWYNANDEYLAKGTSYTAPRLAASSNFYVTSYNEETECESEKTKVEVVFNNLPVTPVFANVSRCGAGEITLTKNDDKTYVWTEDGETILFTGSSYTVTLNETKTFYVQLLDETTGCKSESSHVTAAINAIPAAPVLNDVPVVCGNGSVTLTANTPNALRWYAGLDSTEPLTANQDGSYTTPELSENTTYYVSAYDEETTCESEKTQVTVQVSAIPQIQETKGDIRCGAGEVTLQATATAGAVIDWFMDNKVSTKAFQSGTELVAAVDQTTTYYVAARNAETGCASERVAIVAQVNPVPAAPEVSPIANCGAGEFTLTAASEDIVKWYADEVATQALASTTVSVNTTTTYYAQASNTDGCVSEVSALTITIMEVPAAPVVNTPAAICGEGSRELTATPAENCQIKWYTQDDEYITTGNTYNTGNLTASATYHVTNAAANCESTPTIIEVLVNAVPAQPAALNQNRCGAGDIQLTASVDNSTCDDCQLKWYADQEMNNAVGTGDVYTPNVTETTTYYVANVNNATQCASQPVTVKATVYPVYTNVEDHVTACDRYTWEGTEYTESGAYTKTLKTVNDCDSIVTLNLTINQSRQTVIDTTVCDLFEWNGNTYNKTQEIVGHFTSADNCDSTVTIHLTVNKTTYGTDKVTICSNELPYTYQGNVLTEAGNYAITIKNAAGCDSIITLTLVVNPQPAVPTISDVTRCGAGVVNLNATPGQYATTCRWYADNNPETEPFSTGANIAPTVQTTTEYYVTSYDAANTYCESERILVKAIVNASPAAPTISDVARCGEGTVVLTAQIGEDASTCRWYGNATTTTSLGEGMTYEPMVYTTTTYYVESYDAQTTCKSTTRTAVVATVRDIPATPSFEPMSNCGAATFNVEAPATGNYVWYETAESTTPMEEMTYNVTPVVDASRSYFISRAITYEDITCESAKGELKLTIYPDYAPVTLYDTICQNAVCTNHGLNETFNEPGNFARTLSTTSSNGCDSLVTLNINVKEKKAYQFTDKACSEYVWNGTTYTESGVYEQTLTAANGCDSVVTLTLTINQPAHTEFSATACDSYTWNDKTYSESGEYTQHFNTVNGCDSTVVLTLTINKSVENDIYETACDSYTWNDKTYQESGLYTQSFKTIHGCDSVVNLHLTINYSDDVQYMASVCAEEPYAGYGFEATYATAGTYTLVHNDKNVKGCDSTTTLTLTVYPTYHKTINTTICENATYNFNGRILNEVGTYYDTLQTINGCDSTFILNLSISHEYRDTIDAHICMGESYNENGFDVANPTATDYYSRNLIASNMCDSIVVLHLFVHDLNTTNLSDAICEGESYDKYGFNIEKPAVGTKEYTNVVKTAYGCDSTVVLTLTVNPVYNFNFEDVICLGERYQKNGFDTLPATAGKLVITQAYQTADCDSIRTLTLTVKPSYNLTKTVTLCSNEAPYEFAGEKLTESGHYTHNFYTTQGCDSIVELDLIINSVQETKINASICLGNAYTENGFNIKPTEVGTTTHYQNLKCVNTGCDSTVILTLTTNRVDVVNIADNICLGETYDNHNFKVTPEKAGVFTYVNNNNNAFGCDSTTTLTLTVNPVYDLKYVASICQGETYVGYGFDTLVEAAGVHTLVHATTTTQGCDSTTTVTLTVYPTFMEEYTVDICDNETPYKWNNSDRYTYYQSGNYDISYKTVNGCDSIIRLHLNVHPTFEKDTVINVCQGSMPYAFNEDNIFTKEGQYDVNMKSAYGCDSIYHVSLMVTPFTRTTERYTVCQSELPYIYNDTTVFTEAGQREIYVKQGDGCDLIKTIVLTVNPTYVTEETVYACANELPYMYGEHALTTAGTETIHFSTAAHCDSTVLVTLVVWDNPTSSQVLNLCDNEFPVHYGDSVFTKPGQYTVIFQEAGKCDSIVSLTINQWPTFLYKDNAVVCDNQIPYQWHERTLTETGVYYDSLTTVNGCDSVYVLNLTVNPTYYTETVDTICSYETYAWRGKTYSESGVYYDSLTTVNGCDSVFALLLTVNKANEYKDADIVLCQGETQVWRGQTVSETKLYTDIVVNENSGCNDFYSVNVIVNPTYFFEEAKTICSDGGTYTWHGRELTQSGTYYDSLQTVNGCDSIYKFELIMNRSYSFEEQLTLCASEVPYTWHDQNLTKSGIYYDSQKTVNGCDSIYTLNLTVNPTYAGTENATVCSYELPYEWHGRQLTQSGTYTDTLKAVNGCDSVRTLRLTVNESKVIASKDIISCQGETETWRGRAITETGTYTDTVMNANGCYDVYTVNAVFHPTYLFEETVTVCDDELPYTWRGQSLKTAGAREDRLATAEFYCDSIYRITLIVTPTYKVADKATICDSEAPYQWRGRALTQSGFYYDSLKTVAGCDSVFTLDLVVNKSYKFEEKDEICDSKAPYEWHGQKLTKTGIYYDNMKTKSGCDSIYVMNLTVNPTYLISNTDEICSYDLPYEWQGRKLMKSGVYDDTLSTVAGCDSIIRLTLTVNESHVYNDNDIVLCQGTTQEWRGRIMAESGFYTDTVTNAAGCYDVYTVNVTVNPTYAFHDTVTLCDSELPYKWHNKEYTATGDYELALQTVNTYCDSIYTLHMVVMPSFASLEKESVCDYDLPYEWHGQKLTQSGTYYDKQKTAFGCDSIYTLELTVNPSVHQKDSAVVCSSELPYQWRGRNITEAGLHTDTVPNSYGCQDVYELMLTVNQAANITLYDTICQGERYTKLGFDTLAENYGTIYAQQQLTTVAGCDSIVNLVLTVNRTYFFESADTTCSNHPYEWHGKTYDKTGTYYDNLTTVTGCDSIFVLNLVVNPAYYIEVEDSIKLSESYTEYGLDFQPEEAGSYDFDIQYYTVEGCDSIVHITLFVIDDTGIDDVVTSADVTCYPNPTTTLLNIKGEQMAEVFVYSNTGRLLDMRKADSDTFTQIDMSKYSTGYYIVRIKLESGYVVNKKVVVQHN